MSEERGTFQLLEKKASRIKVSTTGVFDDQEKWEDAFKWLKTTGEKFKAVFPKYF